MTHRDGEPNNYTLIVPTSTSIFNW